MAEPGGHHHLAGAGLCAIASAGLGVYQQGWPQISGAVSGLAVTASVGTAAAHEGFLKQLETDPVSI